MNNKNVHFNFEDLKVYQKALDFTDVVYHLTKSFPTIEQYNLNSQFNRAAVSIALNIAEGHGDSNAQFNRFLQIAKDSVNECVVCNAIAFRRGYITKENNKYHRVLLSELAKMITGLTKYLKSNN
ncbi:MAG: four helix bundle protein [Flavobacteriaceae bacterium]